MSNGLLARYLFGRADVKNIVAVGNEYKNYMGTKKSYYRVA